MSNSGTLHPPTAGTGWARQACRACRVDPNFGACGTLRLIAMTEVMMARMSARPAAPALGQNSRSQTEPTTLIATDTASTANTRRAVALV
jgi:hypothetical protein